MAYNPIDVTAGKGDVINGPLWYSRVPYDKLITLDFDPSANGFVKIGEASTDGFDNSQSADATDKNVWGGKSLGKTYSNFQDSYVIRLASSTDPDVLAMVFGKDNVTKANGAVNTVVGPRQPTHGSFLIQMITDDGRKSWHYVPAGQPDLNLTRSFSDTEIVIIETTVNALQTVIRDADTNAVLFNGTHIEIVEDPIEDPEDNSFFDDGEI